VTFIPEKRGKFYHISDTSMAFQSIAKNVNETHQKAFAVIRIVKLIVKFISNEKKG
jgi:hypothetical protein